MERGIKRFTQAERTLMKRANDAILLSMDAVPATPTDNARNTVRLHLEGFDIDANNHLCDIIVDEFGTLEGFGLLSVEE